MRIIVAIVIVLIIYFLQNLLYKRLWDKNLDVDIHFGCSYMETGERAKLYEVIANGKRLPLPVLHVKFSVSRYLEFDDASNSVMTDLYYRNDAFSIMGGQKITRALEFKANRRGYYIVENTNLLAKNFFMTETFAKNIHPMTGIYVFAKKHDDLNFNVMMNSVIGELETRFHIMEDPYTFRGIREYSNQDTMSRINWKASAKTGSLMVNLYNQTSECKVKIMLNLDTNVMVKSDYMKELSIELASSAAKKLIEAAMPVMLITNGKNATGERLPVFFEGATKSHLVTIDKQLACITENDDAAEFVRLVEEEINKKEEHTAYIIISSYHKKALMEKLDEMIRRGMNVNFIVPYYDQYPPEVSRSYMYGWEVSLNDT